jgi:uncharacterized protein YjbI with pentapeptide repeats
VAGTGPYQGENPMTGAELQRRLAAGQRHFFRADLHGEDLAQADLHGVDLHGADLTDAALSQVVP